MTKRNSPWLVRRAPRDDAALRLFCFPYAGAGSVIYRDWFAALPQSIDVCAIEPPGRLARRNERAPADVHEFTKALQREIEPYLDLPFALFGYSLGALMAFECARALRRDQKLEPAQLIVAAHKAPQMPRKQPSMSREPRDVFVRTLERRYGPLEPVIKADPEMLDAIVEIMRCDLGMLENYMYEAEAPFDCPIVALAGTEDATFDAAELQAWQAHTSGEFRTAMFPGGHFFLREHGAKLRTLVANELLARISTQHTGRVSLDASQSLPNASG